MSSLKGKNVRVRGKWWHYQFEMSGSRHSGSTGLEGVERNRIAAENYAERVRQELLSPSVVAPIAELESAEAKRRMPFTEAAAQFTGWARDVEYRAKPATADRLNVSMASCVAFFAERPVSGLGAEAIEDYKTFRIQLHGVRDVTLRHDLHALSVFFRYAMRKGWAEGNPIELVSIPSDKDAVREHVVSLDEEEKYMAAARRLHEEYVKSVHPAKRKQRRPNMYDLAVLMLELGARPEELLAVRRESVDVAAGTLRITGGKSKAAKRLLNLTPRALQVIEPRLEAGGSEWLFPSDRRAGKHLTKLNCTHDRICREAGVSFVIYDFRHTWATRMIAAGVDVPTVASIMGHGSLRTIYRYVHPTAETQKLAMEKFHAAQSRARLRAVG